MPPSVNCEPRGANGEPSKSPLLEVGLRCAHVSPGRGRCPTAACLSARTEWRHAIDPMPS